MSYRTLLAVLGLSTFLGCGGGNSNDTIPNTGVSPALKRVGNVVLIEPPKSTVPTDYPTDRTPGSAPEKATAGATPG